MLPSRKSIGGTSAMSAAVHTATTPGKRARGRGVDRDDPAVGVVGAHDAHVELMRKGNVGGEAAAAAHQRRVLQPLDRLPDPLVVAGGHLARVIGAQPARAILAAAARTAFTMFS